MDAALARRSTRGVERSLERLKEARDAAVAAMTVPAMTDDSTARLAPEAKRPAVDLTLWTQHVRYARHRDEETLETLVDHYRPHTEALARRFYRHGESVQDLTQTAYEALLLALQRFDPERNRPFLAYAKPTITGAIRRHYRDHGWSMRIPRLVHEMSGPIRNAREMLAQDLGRQPTDAETADYLDIPEDELRELLAALEARQPGSLDAVDPATRQSTNEIVGESDPGLVRAENQTALRQAMELLPASDRQLLKRYYLDELSQTEIAEERQCSQMQVSRLLDRAVRRLRRRIVGV